MSIFQVLPLGPLIFCLIRTTLQANPSTPHNSHAQLLELLDFRPHLGLQRNNLGQFLKMRLFLATEENGQAYALRNCSQTQPIPLISTPRPFTMFYDGGYNPTALYIRRITAYATATEESERNCVHKPHFLYPFIFRWRDYTQFIGGAEKITALVVLSLEGRVGWNLLEEGGWGGILSRRPEEKDAKFWKLQKLW